MKILPGEPNVGVFGVADQTGVVDIFMGKPDVGGGRNFCFGSFVAAAPLDLTSFLRSIILVSKLPRLLVGTVIRDGHTIGITR